MPNKDISFTAKARFREGQDQHSDKPANAGSGEGTPIESRCTGNGHPYSKLIHELIQEQAERTPHAIALEMGEKRLTYDELNKRANQLAHFIVEQGVRQETIAGVCLERSPELIVTLLGVLKAGGAYLPLDPSYPVDRLQFMLDDTGAELLITKQRHLGRFINRPARAVCLDQEWGEISQRSGGEVGSRAGARNLAYVIYTSGSTGRPKGAMIEHVGLANLVRAQAEAFGVGPGSRVLQFASASFDASVSEIFVTLGAGGTLVMADEQASGGGPGLMRAIGEQGITVVTLPPSVLSVQEQERLPGLKTLVVAGEACGAELVERWGRGRVMLNAYGPSEASVCATIGECRVGEGKPGIGEAISNVRVYVLDERLEAVGEGEVGELYIGGAGVGRGYNREPGMTAESFIPDPFGQEAGGRMWRSGDVCRWSSGRGIEYIGRTDEQVKVRGMRVELGEVEEVIRGADGVREAVVVAIGEGADRQLVVYVLREGEEGLEGVKKEAEKRLVGYMVPGRWESVEELPRLPNGKVDRRALRREAECVGKREEGYEEPEGEMERRLAKMWEEVLGQGRIGARDNFFERGGNSLKAAVMLNRLQEELREAVYVVALFDAPTVRELCEYLRRHYREAVSRVYGVERASVEEVEEGAAGRVDEEKIRTMRELIRQQRVGRRREQGAEGEVEEEEKNGEAIFILSPPRSGSTLLRVMMGGHSKLFAPPEMQLLNFETLEERREAFSGRYSFWLEGTVRAIMEVRGVGVEEAMREMKEYEERGISTKEFYREMQEATGGRRLIDKTPSYTLDRGVLERAERYFEGAKYIHLIRHPCGMINSFINAKLDQIFRYEHDYSARELGEMIWVISHENITEFLSGVEESRKKEVRFEEMVKRPREVMEEVSRFLGEEYEEEMMRVYEERGRRMTDGIHGMSRMLGDVKFHEHDRIDSSVADHWRQSCEEESLGHITRELAKSLGYELVMDSTGKEESRSAASITQTVIPVNRIRRIKAAEQSYLDIGKLSDKEVDSMLAGILADEENV